MKKIRNKVKFKKQQAKKARKRRTNAEQKARGRAYSAKLHKKRGQQIREFQQFSAFMNDMQRAQAEGKFQPDLDLKDNEEAGQES